MTGIHGKRAIGTSYKILAALGEFYTWQGKKPME
jgi:hypothetical protein